MSRRIDLTKPLSEEDREFLELRGVFGQYKLAENKANLSMQDHYASGGEEEAEDEGEGAEQDFENSGNDEDAEIEAMSDEERAKTLTAAEKWIDEANVPQLQERLKEWELETSGKKSELQGRLREAVEAKFGPKN